MATGPVDDDPPDLEPNLETPQGWVDLGALSGIICPCGHQWDRHLPEAWPGPAPGTPKVLVAVCTMRKPYTDPPEVCGCWLPATAELAERITPYRGGALNL